MPITKQTVIEEPVPAAEFAIDRLEFFAPDAEGAGGAAAVAGDRGGAAGRGPGGAFRLEVGVG